MWERQNQGISAGSGKGSEAIRSGYRVENVKGLGYLKQQFATALELNASDVTEEQVLKNARLNGQLKGFGVLAKHASKQKLEVARNALGVYNTVINHANQAARNELQWQTQTSRGLQSMSETLLSLNETQEIHGGYQEHLRKADDLIRF